MAESWAPTWKRRRNPNSRLAQEFLPETPVRPVSKPVVVADTPELEEYRTLAAALNFHPTGIEDPTLDRLLQRLGIEVFDREAVATFLTAACARLGREWRWEWAPVGLPPISTFSFSFGGIPVYADPIPLRVLRRMHVLQTEAPEVAFFVSRITNRPKADPFLLAVLHSVTRVIDCWDEPGFTG